MRARVIEQMIEGGVDLIQLRGKDNSIGELMESISGVPRIDSKIFHAADRERSR